MSRKEPLNKEEKNMLAILLKKLNIMPSRQGRIVIETTAEQSIGCIEVLAVYR
jgi:hypothetical protein